MLKYIGIIVTLLLALGLPTFGYLWRMNERMILNEQAVAQIRADKARDDQQDNSLRMLWRYTAWSETQIAKLRHNAGLEPADKPEWD